MRIRESQPGGESSQKEAGNMGKVQFQFVKGFPGALSQEGPQHAAAHRPITAVPFPKEGQNFPDVGQSFRGTHRACHRCLSPLERLAAELHFAPMRSTCLPLGVCFSSQTSLPRCQATVWQPSKDRPYGCKTWKTKHLHSF